MTTPHRDRFPTQLARDLYEVSGHFEDSRRFVAWLYLLCSEHTPLQRVGDALHRAQVGESREGYPGVVRIASRLCENPPPLLQRFVLHLATTTYVPESLLERIPTDDSVSTHFSNGWLARYCAWVADQVLSPLPQPHVCTPPTR